MGRPRKRRSTKKAAAPRVPDRWAYEPDETPKRKHAWHQAHAGFVKVRGVLVGKCPSGLPLVQAEALLNTGIPFPMERWGQAWPDRIYVVHEGVVYRAHATNPGRSYHAFPELGRELRRLPRDFQNRLIELARSLGCEREVRRWIRR